MRFFHDPFLGFFRKGLFGNFFYLKSPKAINVFLLTQSGSSSAERKSKRKPEIKPEKKSEKKAHV